FRAIPTWRARLTLMRWLLAPSPTALRLGEPLRYPRVWPAYYLLRPPAYVARRIRRSWSHARQTQFSMDGRAPAPPEGGDGGNSSARDRRVSRVVSPTRPDPAPTARRPPGGII